MPIPVLVKGVPCRCPWCGKRAVCSTPYWVDIWHVHCVCGGRGPRRKTSRGAINAWNKVAWAMAQRGK